MARLLEEIGQDEVGLARALQGLEEALRTLGGGDPRVREAGGRSLDRCLDFLAGAEARKLDLILELLRERNPSAAGAVGELAAEREELVALAESLAAAIEGLRPQDDAGFEHLSRIGREFAMGLRWRIQRVEQQILPMALVLLGEDDWKEIEARLGEAAPREEGRP